MTCDSAARDGGRDSNGTAIGMSVSFPWYRRSWCRRWSWCRRGRLYQDFEVFASVFTALIGSPSGDTAAERNDG